MSGSPDSNRFDRRQFTKQLASLSGAATTVILAATVAAADDTPPPAAPNDAKPERKEEDRVARPSEELLLLNLIVQRYSSDRFDDAAIRGIYGEIRGDLARGRILSQFPLNNSDGPSPAFLAYRGAR